MRSSLIVLITLVLLFSSTACSKNVDNSRGRAEQANKNSINSDGVSTTTETFNPTAFSQANLQGVISNIAQNRVTLNLIEPWVMPGSMLFNDKENLPEGNDPEYLREQLGISGLPENFDPENMPEAFVEQLLLVKYTGESIELEIPTSLSILADDDLISVTSLLPNQVISIWYGEDGETITLMQVQGIAFE